MKIPRRLTEENALFACLVADANRREPPPGALHALLRTLDSEPRSATDAGGASRMPWPHSALVGAAGLLVLAALTAKLWPAHEAALVVPSAAAATVLLAPEATVRAEPEESVPMVSVDDLPDSKAPLPTARFDRVRRSVGPSSSSSAPRELDLIVQAREVLTRDPRACLTVLELHAREFPSGQFRIEAEVMRIEATVAAGDRAGADALALAYLAKNPKSPYEARVRSLVASMEDR